MEVPEGNPVLHRDHDGVFLVQRREPFGDGADLMAATPSLVPANKKNYDRVEKVRGMDITFVTTAANDEQCKALLTHLGMPFRK